LGHFSHVGSAGVSPVPRAWHAQAPGRPLHWDPAQDALRQQTWWTLEQRSQARLKALLEQRQDFGVYGLGAARTLADYAGFCGVDYAARSLAPKAYRGPWRPGEG
jgi:hypothetical protein